ncbi:hypothetical protein KFE96_13610 [Kordiimonas sp. SCSIO 12603]|uniref:hypothetical protein n=1 Tax=Kordiimonas sp. SCSIO 12603 TaxID=2829596 RepID=UPI0021050B01|nr:hypothetical protein [Kordiimonas sp. SCSIO 12603]UTW57855.1 hypothetical protein KFE96_13610 [Kordiimonas sp. SCSIO 12603]
MKRILKASIFVISLATSASVMAQSAKDSKIPQELLELDRKRCETGCLEQVGEQVCKMLCECTISEFQKRLDFDKYLELSAQLSREEISPENRLLLDVIAKRCTAVVEKSGIQIEQSPPKEADQPKQN